MKKILMIAAAAAVCLAACSKNEDGIPGDRTLRITPTIGNPSLTPAAMTAASTRATDTDFELGDKVGLKVTMTADGKDFVSNKPMTFDGTDYKAEGFLWYEDVNATSTLFAYYPWQEGGDIPAEFSVKADQSGDNYTASDLIVAVKAGVKPTLSSTQMTFKHKMSRIVIDVTNESGFDITNIVIKGAVGTGVLDPATGNFTAKADAEASDLIANTATANKVYYALLVPQNGVKLMVTVTTADGKKRTQTLGTADFKSGENRRMEGNVQPADIELKFSGPITGWVDGDDLLPDGEGEVETPTVEWGGVKYEIVTLKDGRTWMAENLRYVPEGKTISSDPKDGSGVWYPCNLSKAADPSLVESNGLLYSYPVMLGMTGDMTGDNFDQYEGARGICPEGWHISNWRVSAAATSPIRRRPISNRRRAAVRSLSSIKTGLTSQAAVMSMRQMSRRLRPIWRQPRLPTPRRSAWGISPVRPAIRLPTIRPTTRPAALRTFSIMPA